MTINLRLFFQSLLQLLILFSLNEQFYSSDLPTGYYNLILTFAYLAFSFIFVVFDKRYLRFTDFLIPATTFCYVLYMGGGGYHARVYALTTLLFFLASVLSFENCKLLFGGTIWMGLFYSVRQYLDGIPRVTGFFNTSPTIFSMVLLIALCYFNFSPLVTKGERVFYSVLSLGQIYLTSSRSTFFLALMLIFWVSIIQPLLQTKRLNTPAKAILFITITLLSSFLVFLLITSFQLREDAFQSSEARQQIFEYFFRAIIENPKEYIFGKGAGYTLFETARLLPWIKTETYPLHQDILMWLVEYGFVGFVVLYFVLFFKKTIHWVIYLLFLVGSFHNLFIAPILVLLLTILNNQLVRERKPNVSN
ncbi:O-antigen ligase family protein [Streptococcus entericus]|uniref:O-antigen ligase family protein n=1 Tax=Streptococcus entericus TaxID=155680 RepID=UPI0003648863|nr:O-antigen ligase family protein [Streptococcus entericus]